MSTPYLPPARPRTTVKSRTDICICDTCGYQIADDTFDGQRCESRGIMHRLCPGRFRLSPKPVAAKPAFRPDRVRTAWGWVETARGPS